MTTRQKELPAGWKWVKLGDVCKDERTAIRPDDPVAKTLPYLALEDIETQTGKILIDRESELNESIKSNTFTFDSHHILYGKLRPYLNKVSAPVFAGRCSTELIPLLPTSGSKDYLLWYLRRPETVDFAMQTAFGARMPRTDMVKFLEMPIPLPPLDEQERIAGILNKAEEIKKLREEADKKTEELIPAIFHEMVGSRIKKGEELPVGWKWVSLGDVCDFILDGSHGSPKRGDSGIPLLSAKHIKDGRLIFEDFECVTQGEYTTFAKRLPVSPTDVLLAIIGASIGRVARVNTERQFMLLRSVAVLKSTSQRLHHDFLFWGLQSSVLQWQMKESSHGVAQNGLYLRDIKALRLPLPPLEEQKRIAERLNRAEEIKKSNGESDKKIEELKSSLLQRAFRGEL